MKYLLIVPDGMADHPLDQLGGRTPVEAALTPNLDAICMEGILGSAHTTCSSHAPGSDVATMCLLGYNPDEFYTGRAPIEAASMNIELGPLDTAVRCNLITADHEKLIDYSGGAIPTEDGHKLIRAVADELGTDELVFYPGISYRNILVRRGKGDLRVTANPPHDVMNRRLEDVFPTGEDAGMLRDLMRRSRDILEQHPINRNRVQAGKSPANMIWLWGNGLKPALPTFEDRFGRSGCVIAAVDLIKGLGQILGWDVPNVKGATGYFDTDYDAKADAGIEALKDHDFVFVHVEAPDEAGHEGNIEEKIKAIEAIDEKVIGPCVAALKQYPEYRVLVLPDHPTPIAIRTHVKEAVPFAMCGTGVRAGPPVSYSEANAKVAEVQFENGYELMGYFLDS
ncbi:MAG: cofactor-independent phosphoglycerate mutase [Planctomycetota bacterium]|nr:cofactor-independent phosphoglycerate mutase [Planctomycetota bacterium]